MVSANETKLRTVIATVFNVAQDKVDENASVDTISAWDSLNHLNLILALESEFGVTFTEEQTVEILNYPLVKMTLSDLGVEF